jgi:hypothetical protein
MEYSIGSRLQIFQTLFRLGRRCYGKLVRGLTRVSISGLLVYAACSGHRRHVPQYTDGIHSEAGQGFFNVSGELPEAVSSDRRVMKNSKRRP